MQEVMILIRHSPRRVPSNVGDPATVLRGSVEEFGEALLLTGMKPGDPEPRLFRASDRCAPSPGTPLPRLVWPCCLKLQLRMQVDRRGAVLGH